MKNPEHAERQFHELARRLNLTYEQVVNTPIVVLAMLMVAKDVSSGLTVVGESDTNVAKPA